MPRANQPYWKQKITRNMRRDRGNARRLRRAGWRVLRFWEHSLRAPESVARRIASKLAIKRNCGVAYKGG